MGKWVALCNGGPNDTTVGRECDSLGKACGALESMMTSLGASRGSIERVDHGQRKVDSDYFVATENEAGKKESCIANHKF